MRDLNSIASHPDLDLAVAAAQLTGHESAKVPDHDAIIDLQTKLEVRGAHTAAGIGRACWMVGEAGELR